MTTLNHFFLFTLFAFLFSACGNAQTTDTAGNLSKMAETANDSIPETDSIAETAEAIDTLTIIGVGDIMLGTSYPNNSTLPPQQDCNAIWSDVKPVLENADVTFGNLEGVLIDGGTAKHCNDPSVCYTFRMPESFVECFVNAGFDLISIANNHVNDFGQGGRTRTQEVLTEAGLTFAGLADNPSAVFEKDGIKYGFCAFAPHRGTASLHDLDAAKELVAHLDSTCNVVIVSFHAGAEGKAHQHVPRKNEYFLGANRGNVYQFSHGVIDAGADIVFGHGPHVTRAIDVYNNRFIAYSLGNFCTYSRINITGVSGLAPIIKVYTTPNGEFLKAHITPTYQQKYKGTFIDPDARVIEVIRQLTREDLPELNISISDDGWVTVNEND